MEHIPQLVTQLFSQGGGQALFQVRMLVLLVAVAVSVIGFRMVRYVCVKA